MKIKSGLGLSTVAAGVLALSAITCSTPNIIVVSGESDAAAGGSTGGGAGTSASGDAGTSGGAAGTVGSPGAAGTSATGTAGTSGGAAGTVGSSGGAGTGAAGTIGAAGTSGGGAGTVGAAGTTAENPTKGFDGFRYENPCGYVDGHTLGDGTCRSGEICWPTAAKAHKVEHKPIVMGGDPAVVYQITLRIRGAIEPRDYPTACTLVSKPPIVDTIGICTGGNPLDSTATFNIWELKIDDPAQTYYLNSVPAHPMHRVDSIDQTFTIKARGQTKVTFTMDDLNGGEIRNCSVVIAGIAPAPNRYDGNFFQLNVTDWKVAP